MSGVRVPHGPPRAKGRTLANGNVGRGSGLVRVCGPGQSVGIDLRIEEHLEGPVVLDAQLVVLVVLRIGDDEPGSALATVNGAFEVVAVDLGCLDGALVRGELGLELVPDLGRNERRVVALVADASVDDIALVVRVGQEPVDGGCRQRLRWPLRRVQAAQPALCR